MVAALMEAYWGMGTGISSLTALQSLGIGPGKPEQRGGGGGGMGFGATPVKAPDPVAGQLGERIEKLLAKMLERAEEILTESRREVLALAHALETHKTLTGDDVLAVIDARQGPIIDGTIYQDADFAHDLELYHQAAVSAHQGHTQVSLTLPATEQPTPQIEEPATA
jgi:hypothetical protein